MRRKVALPRLSFRASPLSSLRPAGLSALASSPELYPQMLDPAADRAWFIRLPPQRYEEASFLDERVLGPGQTGEWLALEEVEAAVAGLPERCDFIFHIGHVGSTLVSRLLGALPGVFALREPTPLPILAHLAGQLDRPESLWSRETFESRLALFLKLWSRTGGGGTALVKATSWASDLAAPLLARPRRPRALLMMVEPEVFLTGVHASPGAWDDVRNGAQASLQRLHDRLGERPWVLHAMSPGERMAMSWACEMTALTEARAAAGDGALWIDFEAFLAAPGDGLTAAARHLGLDPDPGQIQALVSGPIMQRYSKLPQLPFDADFRRRVLAGARQDHAEEIARGMAWLDSASARFPSIAVARSRLG